MHKVKAIVHDDDHTDVIVDVYEGSEPVNSMKITFMKSGILITGLRASVRGKRKVRIVVTEDGVKTVDGKRVFTQGFLEAADGMLLGAPSSQGKETKEGN